jgi:hypothetical protein
MPLIFCRLLLGAKGISPGHKAVVHVFKPMRRQKALMAVC